MSTVDESALPNPPVITTRPYEQSLNECAVIAGKVAHKELTANPVGANTCFIFIEEIYTNRIYIANDSLTS